MKDTRSKRREMTLDPTLIGIVITILIAVLLTVIGI